MVCCTVSHFFELAGELTMEIGFIVTNEMADRPLESLRHEQLSLVYARLPAQFGVIGQQAHPGLWPGSATRRSAPVRASAR